MAGHKCRWWLACGAVFMIIGCALTPASASAQDELLVSHDARHWHPDLDLPLFDHARRWVPGDELTTSFWIHNSAATSGDLRLTVEPVDHDQLLRTGLHLRARTPDSGWISLGDGSARRIAGRLPSGATTRLWIVASFDSAAGNVSQDRRTDLRLHVTLSQLIDGGQPDDSGDDEPPVAVTPGPDGLAGTGPDVSSVVVIIGAIAIGAGAALVRRPRGQHPEHHRD